MRINTNLNALTALNNSTKTTALAGNSMEKLSSGLRINKAGDDAAGLAISEKMRSQIRGLEQASKNAQDGISVVQTAEGAMEEVGNIVQRMRELSVQASNETNGASDRAKIQEELEQLYEEIDRIAQSTEFNGKNLLNEGVRATIAASAVDATIAGGTNKDKIENLEIEGFVGSKYNSGKLTLDSTGKKYVLTLTDAEGRELIATADVNDGETGTAGIQQTDIEFDFGNGNKITLDVKEAKADEIKDTPQDITITAGKKEVAVNDLVQNTGLDMQLQVGANTGKGQALNINISNISTAGLGLDKMDLNLKDGSITAGTKNANNLINKLDSALETINTSRANLGAIQNRLETTQSNLTTSTENLTAAESRIRDVDVADEMMNLSKLNLINQAAQAMMVQAKSQPENVMQLLR